MNSKFVALFQLSSDSTDSAQRSLLWPMCALSLFCCASLLLLPRFAWRLYCCSPAAFTSARCLYFCPLAWGSVFCGFVKRLIVDRENLYLHFRSFLSIAWEDDINGFSSNQTLGGWHKWILQNADEIGTWSMEVLCKKLRQMGGMPMRIHQIHEMIFRTMQQLKHKFLHLAVIAFVIFWLPALQGWVGQVTQATPGARRILIHLGIRLW